MAAKVRLSKADAADLEPFGQAAMRGLGRARWRPGDPVEWLVAPIVLAVLAEVGRTIRETTATCENRKD